MVNENAHIRFVLKLLLLFSIHTTKLISFQEPGAFFSLSFHISSHISFSQNFGKHLVGVTSSQKNALLSENAVPDCRYFAADSPTQCYSWIHVSDFSLKDEKCRIL